MPGRGGMGVVCEALLPVATKVVAAQAAGPAYDDSPPFTPTMNRGATIRSRTSGAQPSSSSGLFVPGGVQDYTTPARREMTRPGTNSPLRTDVPVRRGKGRTLCEVAFKMDLSSTKERGNDSPAPPKFRPHAQAREAERSALSATGRRPPPQRHTEPRSGEGVWGICPPRF